MTFQIHWSFFMKVNSTEKCRRMIAKVANAIGADLVNVNAERYWKDETLFKVTAESFFESPTLNDGFYAVMRTANCLARAWLVNGPHEDGSWEFEGTANRDIRIPGVEWVGFRACQVQAQEHRSATLNA